MKPIFTTILSLVFAAMFAIPSFAGKRTVKVGYFRYPGCHMVGESGKRSGYGYELYERIAKFADWNIEYVGYERPWVEMLSMLERGEIDVLDFVTVLPERKDTFAFSKSPMAFTGTSLRTIPARAPWFKIENMESWRKVRVGVVEGDSNEETFVKYADDHNLEYEVVRYPQDETVTQAVKDGEVDFAAIDGLNLMDGLVSVGEFNLVRNHYAVRLKDKDLLFEINRAIKRLGEAEPDWMMNARGRYYPLKKTVAYVPETMDKATAEYLRRAVIRISEINNWDLEFRPCNQDFSNADFSGRAIGCGLVMNFDTTRKFEVPKLAIGRRRAEIFVRPDDARFAGNCIPVTNIPYRVGVLDSDVPARKKFERYALRNDFSFRIVPARSPDDLSSMLEKSEVDMIVRPSAPGMNLRSVGVCGYVDFFIAPPKGNLELLHELTDTIKFLRLDDPNIFPWLEKYTFGTVEDERRHVVLGAYNERGLSECDDEGECSGFCVDFAEQIAERAGWNLTPVLMTYPEAQRALADGVIDLMGAVVWTPDRAEVYDYSKFNIGPLNYALMKRPDGRMRENSPDTWHKVRIGLMRGTKANQELEKYLEERGVRWRPRYFNDPVDAEAALRRGEIDAVYTLSNYHNRDLTTLAILPTALCYFCSNKSKPWIKEDLDRTVDEFLREDCRWINDLTEKYLSTGHKVLDLSVAEIDYVQEMRGKPITIVFNTAVPPLVSIDRASGELVGFYPRLFQRFSERVGLDFTLLPPGSKADVMITFGDTPGSDLDEITMDGWMKAPTCWVKRRGLDDSGHGIVAVPEYRKSEISFIEQSGLRPLLVKDYREGYDAVNEGRAEMIIDNLAVARYMLDELHEYPGLNFQPMDPGVYHRNVALTTSTEVDPRLRSILRKCPMAISQGEFDALVFDSIYSIRPPSVRILTLVITIIAVLALAGIVFLFLVRETRIARAASDAKTRFLNSMSHDIRTPLNAITGFTEIARRHIENADRVSDCLQKIDTAGNHLLMLINEVLDMSRVESGRISLHLEPTNIIQRLESTKVLFSAAAMRKGIKFTMDTSGIRHRWALVDSTRADQILLNVVGNAVKYTRQGLVSVVCNEAPCDREGYMSYILKVSDTGVGMSPEFLKHIFDPFSREETTTMSGVEGTGLGMSIVRKMVDLCGGSIAIDSELGKGTVVTLVFTFALCEPPVQSTAIPDVNHIARISFRGLRVLLVEDNPLNREIARFLLESLGFVVEEAVNGQEAVDKVKASENRFSYDFVLMDIQMPVMNGYEATRAIRTWERSRSQNGVTRAVIPIIAMTANAFEEDRAMAFAAGMNEHIAKPVKSQVLADVLRKFL